MTVVPYLEAGKNYSTAFITADAAESDLETLEMITSETKSIESNRGGGGCDLIKDTFIPALGALAFAMFRKKTES